jgi:hypothetical protein
VGSNAEVFFLLFSVFQRDVVRGCASVAKDVVSKFAELVGSCGGCG